MKKSNFAAVIWDALFIIYWGSTWTCIYFWVFFSISGLFIHVVVSNAMFSLERVYIVLDTVELVHPCSFSSFFLTIPACLFFHMKFSINMSISMKACFYPTFLPLIMSVFQPLTNIIFSTKIDHITERMTNKSYFNPNTLT